MRLRWDRSRSFRRSCLKATFTSRQSVVQILTFPLPPLPPLSLSVHPASAHPHQPHQHLPDTWWNSGNVQNGRPQHAGCLHPLPRLGTLQHQVRDSHWQMFDDGHYYDYYDPADGADDSLDVTMVTPLPREELGLMSCDDISRYSVSSQSGSKGSEAVSYYLDQDSGQYFSLLEGDGPPGPDYDRGRNTGVRRRDKTPTHGKKIKTVQVDPERLRSGVCLEHRCQT